MVEGRSCDVSWERSSAMRRTYRTPLERSHRSPASRRHADRVRRRADGSLRSHGWSWAVDGSQPRRPTTSAGSASASTATTLRGTRSPYPATGSTTAELRGQRRPADVPPPVHGTPARRRTATLDHASTASSTRATPGSTARTSATRRGTSSRTPSTSRSSPGSATSTCSRSRSPARRNRTSGRTSPASCRAGTVSRTGGTPAGSGGRSACSTPGRSASIDSASCAATPTSDGPTSCSRPTFDSDGHHDVVVVTRRRRRRRRRTAIRRGTRSQRTRVVDRHPRPRAVVALRARRPAADRLHGRGVRRRRTERPARAAHRAPTGLLERLDLLGERRAAVPPGHEPDADHGRVGRHRRRR